MSAHCLNGKERDEMKKGETITRAEHFPHFRGFQFTSYWSHILGTALHPFIFCAYTCYVFTYLFAYSCAYSCTHEQITLRLGGGSRQVQISCSMFLQHLSTSGRKTLLQRNSPFRTSSTCV
ncbi:hypothetical protein POVWA2_058180 [Plasmodium ovale wallikeri]|uniref:Uncharacterized protein n=1 Tax=Plasmodium ovale wallikeri TaxID=864142 RepID=A0A1A9A011_PLAOA|nr:hypothetical protein POVWA2_058180 [Plasmodium ovale wallikeri]